MNEITQQLSVAARTLWQRRWLAVGVTWVAAAVCALAVWFVPNRYEASAKLFVDTQSVLKPLMAGLAFQPDLDQQVRMLARTILSRPNIERMLSDPDVGGGVPAGARREAAIDSLETKIKIDHTGGNLYLITYRDQDPKRAKAVVSGLVNLFMDSGNDSKQRDSQEASRFIDEQIKSYELKLVESENRLKDFKLRNFGVSGVSGQDYFARMAALTDDVSKLRMNLSAAEQSRDALKRELASEDPQLPADTVMPAVAAPAQSEVDARLDSQRRQLDDLLRRYTDEHPDVVAARRMIGQLEQQKRQQEADARAKAVASGRNPRSAGNNPVFQRLRISLAEAEANVASLRSQLTGQSERLDQVKATASKVPQAEAELAQLNRDYDILRKQYDQLVVKREAASLGVKIDQSKNMAEYRIVEPPRVPPKAVFPDRQVLAALAMLLAIAAGVASTFGMSKLSPTFDSSEALQALIKQPVLGAVTRHLSTTAKRAQRYDAARLIGVSIVFVAVQMTWIVWLAGNANIT
ncbi:MAG: XrtA system polysaccharide chain length determinant [Rhizobacter sp.]